MADIDIEAPGADEADLQAALLALIAHKSWQRIADSDDAVSVAASSTAEEVLAAIPLPALRGHSRVKFELTALYTNSANNKTLRARLGGTGLNGAAIWTGIQTTTTAVNEERVIKNQGATNSQRCFIGATGGFGSTTAAIGTAAVDTSVPQTLYITGQKATGSEDLTLDSYSVEVLLGNP